MFKKCVILEPVGMNENARLRVNDLAETVIEYPDSPGDEDEIIRRIGDADCLLVSWKTNIGASVLKAAVCIRKPAPTSISQPRENWASLLPASVIMGMKASSNMSCMN